MRTVGRWQVAALATSTVAYIACASFTSTEESPADGGIADASGDGGGGVEDAAADGGAIEEDDLDAEVVGAASKVPEGGKIIFVSSTSIGGNFGGRTGADQKCRTFASSAKLPGSYVAFLRDTQMGASARFTKQTWYRLDGTPAFVDAPTATNAQAPIDVNQYGTRSTMGKAWTGEDGDTAGRTTCDGWTNQSFNKKGIVGDIKNAATWANAGEQSCVVAARLYCFEE